MSTADLGLRELTVQRAFYKAAAPLTISMISFVIAAWRARFIVSVNESMTSSVLLVAEELQNYISRQNASEDFSRRLFVNVIDVGRQKFLYPTFFLSFRHFLQT